MKKWYIALLTAVVIILIIGQVCKANFFHDGTASLQRQEDALNRGFGVQYVMGGDYYQSLLEYPDQFDGLAQDSTITVIGKPTGRIFQQGEFFGQEVKVDSIVKGADVLKKDGETETFYVFCADGFQEDTDGRIRYYGGYGLMQKDSRYLMFLQPASYTSQMQAKGYELIGGFFSHIKLDGNDSRPRPVSVPAEELVYDDVWQFEYIAESEDVLDCVYGIKKRILTSVDVKE